MASKKKTKTGNTLSEDCSSKPAGSGESSAERQPEPAIRQSPRKRPEHRMGSKDGLCTLLRAAKTILGPGYEVPQKEPEPPAQPKDESAVEKAPGKNAKKKLTLKSLTSMEKIYLPTLLDLPGRFLVELFATKKETVYSPNIIYLCKFDIEEECKKEFKAYRNEDAAVSSVVSHIRDHIQEKTKTGQPFFTSSLEYRQKQKELSEKKAIASLKKARKSPPPKTKAKVKPDTDDQAPSPVTEGKTAPEKKSTGKKRKKMDDKENQTTDIQSETQSTPTKLSRESTSSENSLDSASALEDEGGQGENSYIPMPHEDHTYSATPGACPLQEPVPSPSSMSDTSVSSGVSSFSDPSTPAGNTLTGYPFATQEETVCDTAANESAESCDDHIMRTQQKKKKQEEIPQHIKDMAQKCMQEIQTKKKDESYRLICKICTNGKVFTAAASLINHYRSHAGIKPFKCECGRKFTRKHSLNYHSLIHKGKYKFNCEYCDKPFRHKSHYKEHIRKHTGETPYECHDCSPVAKYKTRNTYKRHLKTHHGKILCKNGTIQLSEEEFAKVRTKKYKKSVTGVVPEPSSPSSSESCVSPKREPEEVTTSAECQMPLPPVGTILSGLNPVASQASLGILPPMEAATLAGHALVYSGLPTTLPTAPLLLPSSSQPHTLSVSQAGGIIVCQAISMCQPTVTVSQGVQEQTYYTITGFGPVMAMPGAPALYSAQPTFHQGSGSGDTDHSEYKPVGYVTHS